MGTPTERTDGLKRDYAFNLRMNPEYPIKISERVTLKTLVIRLKTIGKYYTGFPPIPEAIVGEWEKDCSVRATIETTGLFAGHDFAYSEEAMLHQAPFGSFNANTGEVSEVRLYGVTPPINGIPIHYVICN